MSSYALSNEAYTEEELEGGDTRTVMRFHPKLAPIKGKGPTSLEVTDNGEGKLRAKFQLRIPMTAKNPSIALDIDFHVVEVW